MPETRRSRRSPRRLRGPCVRARQVCAPGLDHLLQHARRFFCTRRRLVVPWLLRSEPGEKRATLSAPTLRATCRRSAGDARCAIASQARRDLAGVELALEQDLQHVGCRARRLRKPCAIPRGARRGALPAARRARARRGTAVRAMAARVRPRADLDSAGSIPGTGAAGSSADRSAAPRRWSRCEAAACRPK